MTLSVTLLLGAWLSSESDIEKVQAFYTNYERLILREDFTGAKALHLKVLQAGGNEPLSEAWIRVVQSLSDSDVKLQHYVRILGGDPEREATYKEISLIISEESSYGKEKRVRYFRKLESLRGVRKELLQKYGML